jgi:hypothetical protein
MLLQPGVGPRTGQTIGDGITLEVDPKLVALNVVVSTGVFVCRVFHRETFRLFRI